MNADSAARASPTAPQPDSADQQASILRSLMDFVPEGITVAFGRDAVIYAVSRYGLELIERNDAEVTRIGVEKHLEAWEIYTSDGKSVLSADELPLTRACRGQVVRGEQYLIRSSTGRLIPLLCNAGPITTEEGEVIGGVIAWRDITEVQLLMQQAEEAKNEAQAATRAKDLFLAKLSHELRTPLGSVLGWVKIARSHLHDRAKLEHALDVIERNSKSQVRLVDDLLDQNRIASGNLKLVCALLNLAENVLFAVDAMQPFAAERGVSLVCDVGSGDLVISGDGIRLRQVFCNLINNAVKFSPSGASVDVRLFKEGDVAIIEVQDHGVGLDAKHLERVFEPFWQVPGEGAHGSPGLGLGLAIVRHLVAAHDGTVSVGSEGVGAGCTFRVELPI